MINVSGQKDIQKLGYELKSKSNYDGGIDIRAVKILDCEKSPIRVLLISFTCAQFPICLTVHIRKL